MTLPLASDESQPLSGVFTEPVFFSTAAFGEEPLYRCSNGVGSTSVTAAEQAACRDTITSTVAQCSNSQCPCFDREDLASESCISTFGAPDDPLDVVRRIVAGVHWVAWFPAYDLFACDATPLHGTIPREAAFGCIELLSELPDCDDGV